MLHCEQGAELGTRQFFSFATRTTRQREQIETTGNIKFKDNMWWFIGREPGFWGAGAPESTRTMMPGALQEDHCAIVRKEEEDSLPRLTLSATPAGHTNLRQGVTRRVN